jgi:hypothetical protein
MGRKTGKKFSVFFKTLKHCRFLCPLINGGSHEKKSFTQVPDTAGCRIRGPRGFSGAKSPKKPRLSEEQSQKQAFWDCFVAGDLAFFGRMFNRGGVAGDFGIQFRGSGILRL